MSAVAAATVAVGVYSANKQAKAQGAAASAAERQADLAYKRSLPWDVKGDFGEAIFDEGGRTLGMKLSAPWQSEYDVAMEGAKKQRGYISGFEGDPMAAGKTFYDMQKAIYAPEQEKDRLSLESRLLAQGMLGSTGGAGRMEALRKAQAMQDLEAQYAGLDKAQGYIDTYRGRSAADLGMAETIGQLPQKYAETGRGIGTGLGSIAGTAAKLSSAAAQARGQSQANQALGYAGMFSNLAGGGSGSGAFGDLGSLGNFNTASTFNTNPWSEQSAMLAEQRM
jgi:hypothetical protein